MVKKKYIFKTREQWWGTEKNSLDNASTRRIILVEEEVEL